MPLVTLPVLLMLWICPCSITVKHFTQDCPWRFKWNYNYFRIQSLSAVGARRFEHTTPAQVILELYWFPVPLCAQFKGLVVTYKAHYSLGPKISVGLPPPLWTFSTIIISKGGPSPGAIIGWSMIGEHQVKGSFCTGTPALELSPQEGPSGSGSNKYAAQRFQSLNVDTSFVTR